MRQDEGLSPTGSSGALALAPGGDIFRCAFHEAPVAAALVRSDGTFVEVNRGFHWLLGYPDDEPVELTFADLAPPGDEPVRVDELTREQEERCIVRADGEPLWVAVSAGRIDCPDGDPDLYVVQIENIADRKRSERKLRRLADHDALTWLLNRRCFLEGLHRELHHLRARGASGALLLLDLDNFKQVNDTSGHPAGDTVLRATADALRRRLRSTDVIGRLGGDEFAAVLLDVSPAQAQDIAEDLTAMLRELEIDASIGVTAFDSDSAATEEELLAQADHAMYAIKSSRR
jgi:diguanylate cyclase (GGDEF)-like protein/PAS domain S-box-containing protein